MTRNARKGYVQRPDYHSFNDHTGFKPLRRKVDQILRRRLNRETRRMVNET